MPPDTADVPLIYTTHETTAPVYKALQSPLNKRLVDSINLWPCADVGILYSHARTVIK